MLIPGSSLSMPAMLPMRAIMRVCFSMSLKSNLASRIFVWMASASSLATWQREGEGGKRGRESEGG